MSLEFAIAGSNYKAGKLDPFKQFHIARRLAPLLSSAGEIMKAHAAASGDDDEAAMLAALEPVTRVLGSIPDADVEYVLGACLDVVSREQEGGKGWARVRSSGGALMFDDIDMVAMLQIAWNVLRHNLGGFSHALRQLSNGAGLTSKASNG